MRMNILVAHLNTISVIDHVMEIERHLRDLNESVHVTHITLPFEKSHFI